MLAEKVAAVVVLAGIALAEAFQQNSYIVLTISGPLVLDPKPTVARLLPAQRNRPPSWFSDMDPDRDYYLVIRRLHAATPPGIEYEIYLGEQGTRSESSYVGPIHFFGSARTSADPMSRPFFSFNVTSVLRQWFRTHKDTDYPMVTIVPMGEPAGDASPIIGQLQLVSE